MIGVRGPLAVGMSREDMQLGPSEHEMHVVRDSAVCGAAAWRSLLVVLGKRRSGKASSGSRGASGIGPMGGGCGGAQRRRRLLRVAGQMHAQARSIE
jgi:hypothetical protein